MINGTKSSNSALQTISLVTGGAGFVGSHVAKHLIANGQHVIVLDDLSGGNKLNIPAQCTFINGSINDNLLLDKLFAQYKIDYIFHLAAYATDGLTTTYNWAKEQEYSDLKKFKSIEVYKNMPESWKKLTDINDK